MTGAVLLTFLPLESSSCLGPTALQQAKKTPFGPTLKTLNIPLILTNGGYGLSNAHDPSHVTP